MFDTESERKTRVEQSKQPLGLAFDAEIGGIEGEEDFDL